MSVQSPRPVILSPPSHPPSHANPADRPDIQDQENERQREEAEVRAKSRGRDARLTLPAKQNQAGASGSGDKEKRGEKDGKWIQGIDYAYEYVPVIQKRQGRKNM
ncbi:hypothetical protein I350_06575 [Cryptococcus amylolentus CBS 6273]|uniref:Uncharacterized protein n=1 Tax=Cryptococcus amylolentus CBS 6273 TaxID=1296118 RepID=A0A1E3JM63_9TREE|nr:hypothetical protein I350_06575 [Cryptococcus amylolentus CBS 6273]